MESGVVAVNNSNYESKATSTITIKGILSLLMESIDENCCDGDGKRVISLGMGDPTLTTCFHASTVVEEAVADTLKSHKFHGYAPTAGLLQARIAIAEYLSGDLPYQLSSDDVFITCGCTQAIDVSVAMLARPGANILLPRPGFPIYELCAAFRGVEVRHYDLLPQKDWEVDLDAVEALADQNTVALVIINPGNPCGNVYSYHHLEKIAETAKRLGTIVISDEVYGHLAFGANPFVPMGVFGSIVPVLTLGSLSKRWIVPGWRLGWFVTNDPCGTFRKPKVVERIKKYFDLLGGPATFIQAAVPRIIAHTEEVFFKKTIDNLRHTADICCKEIQDIPCIFCPYKPEGSMAMMVKLNLSLLEDISDDIDFCFKLAKEEAVIILPGTAVGLKDWLRITFAADPSALREGMRRIKAFYQRHARRL
ncbi:probable aminotransferase TAT2 isoform X1 [Abrus precatorius]|uniref:Probable aminotransferase TAT2 isoform X1 n=1 Tax=Abrus precatorius TaxID=3816 RepID=A0A8B8LJT2_ABRPR|nr:probable aminotransferase TAT2 isoform X1 [Abrus precatorius]XP_027356651.1 probable aminotransferase TAT2 isoform X1 [Abrus precatorius]